jgi:hypothetical protein
VVSGAGPSQYRARAIILSGQDLNASGSSVTVHRDRNRDRIRLPVGIILCET